jgi:phosphatidylethanolamine-binding protein (PEBP) family uncharacterized protein
MKRRTTIGVLVLACGLGLGAAAHAHPPDEHGAHGEHAHGDGAVRSWTSAKTGEVVRGSFLAFRDGKVSIERENGDVIVFALADLAADDQAEARTRIERVHALNTPVQVKADGKGEAAKPAQAEMFDLFGPFVRTRWDERWLYVESDGLPHAPAAHVMMKGIKSWQQQVPLPQAYVGANAWQIPLRPELADKPVSGKTELRRGAIALAANGVPIFNALNNRGDDAFKAGELDEFGGHSGRADDYHYHVAPLGLQKVVGRDKPIAYALDGFAIYGLFEPGAKAGSEKACPLGGTEKLDEFNGHFGATTKGDGPGPSTVAVPGVYHYHASVGYPYINGGMRGKVTVKDDQIEPQPRANPIREAGKPLRGATITDWKEVGEKSWVLTYMLSGAQHQWKYRIAGSTYLFEFVDPEGTRKETYSARPVRDPRDGENPDRPRRGERRGRADEPAPSPTPTQAPAGKNANGFTLSSASVDASGVLDVACTCDGASASPALALKNLPAGTKSVAVTMHHIPGPPRPGDKPGEDKHVYLVLYDVQAETVTIAKGALASGSKVGTLGVNTVNRRTEYAPPCSKGPGAKVYTLTVYALSSEPKIKPADGRGATMDELLAAIKETTLGTATLDVTYSRPAAK